jgi:hypothetical protein
MGMGQKGTDAHRPSLFCTLLFVQSLRARQLGHASRAKLAGQASRLSVDEHASPGFASNPMHPPMQGPCASWERACFRRVVRVHPAVVNSPY